MKEILLSPVLCQTSVTHTCSGTRTSRSGI
ncbi:Uncharacterised protein [Segatella copri]|nr:Uncharacterised protein [Segatella copri]